MFLASFSSITRKSSYSAHLKFGVFCAYDFSISALTALTIGAQPAGAADAARMRGRVVHTNVFTQQEFADNNMRELRGGLLPILATVALLGGVVWCGRGRAPSPPLGEEAQRAVVAGETLRAPPSLAAPGARRGRSA